MCLKKMNELKNGGVINIKLDPSVEPFRDFLPILLHFYSIYYNSFYKMNKI